MRVDGSTNLSWNVASLNIIQYNTFWDVGFSRCGQGKKASAYW